MSNPENFGDFLKDAKTLLRDYLETRLELYRLQGIRLFSKSAGFLIWIIISMFILFIIIIFFGLVTGFWLSDLTGSYIKGFGLTTLILIAIFGLLAAFRKALFVSPIIRAIISHSENEEPEEADLPNL